MCYAFDDRMENVSQPLPGCEPGRSVGLLWNTRYPTIGPRRGAVHVAAIDPYLFGPAVTVDGLSWLTILPSHYRLPWST